LGVYEYFPAATITGFQSVLAWIGGMHGDREEGIELMKKTSKGGKLFQNEANFALGLMYSFRENNLSTGYDYWNNLSQKFPDNNNFAAQKSRAYFGKLVEDRGVKFLEDEFDSLETVYGVTNPNVLNGLGYTFLNQHKLDDALVVFKVNLKKYPELANCYDSLAECYLTRGENENAIKYYKLAYEKLETDTTITDEFRQFLEEGIQNNLEELGSGI
jgi:tetratricopeptide (TPR) repeat protein